MLLLLLFIIVSNSQLQRSAYANPPVDCYFVCDYPNWHFVTQCNTTVGCMPPYRCEKNSDSPLKCLPPYDCQLDYWVYHQDDCKPVK